MFILLLLVPLLLGCRLVKNENEVFSAVTTKSLKGLFASGVVLHHLCTYFCPPITSIGFYRNLGFIMVSGFFLISGYGLAFSARKKEGYLKGFLFRRVLPIIISFYVSAILYCIMYKHYNMLSLERLKTVMTGANYWFIYAILILYIGFFIAFRFFGKKNAPYACSVWVVGYMAVMYIKGLYAPGVYGFWWFNSCLAFLLGIWFSVHRDKMLAFFGGKYILKLVINIIIFIVSFAGVYLIENKASNTILLCELVASVSFSILVIQLTMKIKVNNFVLRNLGRVSLELYLIQALWIHVIGNEFTTPKQALIRILAIIICTVSSAYAVNYVMQGIMGDLKALKERKL